MGLLHGRAGRLTALFGGFRPGQHDEMGYLLGSRPCIYGWTKDGFVPPPVVRATDKLMSLKMSNNTHARFGDMGLWEIKGAIVPAGTSDTMAASGPGRNR